MASEYGVLGKPPDEIREELDRLKMQLDLEVPAKSLDSNLLIATWNIRCLGKLTWKWEAGENDSPKRDLRALRAIAEIIHRFDVVAVQEVRSHLYAFRELVKALGPHWSYVLTDVSKGDKGNLERMAFLFDTRKLRMSGLACELVVPPDNTLIGPDAFRNQFARTPYAVGFETINSPLKKTTSFVLVTLHVYYGERPGDRVPELRAIAEWMADWARSEYVFDSNLIALGDFNIDRENDPLHRAFTSTGLEAPSELNRVPRTIFSSAEGTHFYDQIAWFSGGDSIPPLNIRYRGAGGFDFLKSLYVNADYTKTQKSWKISDHYPLWAEFDIT